MRLSAIIVTYNSASTIERCVACLIQTLGPNDEIILIDNNSRDETLNIANRLSEPGPNSPYLRIYHQSANLGFAQGCNEGFRLSTGEFIAFINPDVFVTTGWVEKTLKHFEQSPDIGAVGPISNYVAGHQRFDLYLSALPRFERLNTVQFAELVGTHFSGRSVLTKLLIGFCLIMPRRVFKKLGLFDESLFLGNDDIDLSWRLSIENYKMLVALDVFVDHIGQVSFKSNPTALSTYFAEQSTLALAGKFNDYYGIGSVPPTTEVLGLPIFPKEALGVEVSLVVRLHQEDANVLDCFERILAHTPHRANVFIMHSDSDPPGNALKRLAKTNEWTMLPVSSFALKSVIQTIPNSYKSLPLVFLDSRVRVAKGWLTFLLAANSNPECIGAFPQIGPVTNIDAVAESAAKKVGDISSVDHLDLRCFILKPEHLAQFSADPQTQSQHLGATVKVKPHNKELRFTLVNDACVGWVQ